MHKIIIVSGASKGIGFGPAPPKKEKPYVKNLFNWI